MSGRSEIRFIRFVRSLLEQEIAGQRIDGGDRSKRRLQTIAVAGRQSLHRNGVGGRDAVGDILDLLRQDEIEKHALGLAERIEIGSR